MAKTKISEFSATPGNNTDIDGINIAEGCAPSGINDAIRELMSQLKDFQTGAAGDSFNGPVGTTTAAAGAFTTLSASGAFSLTGTSGLTFPDNSTQATAASGFGFKNRIINGAMVIDQRNAGASTAVSAGTTFYGTDRFAGFFGASATGCTTQQSTTAPTGFINSLKFAVGTGASSSSGQSAWIGQRIEGLNVTDLGWGTANAKTVTLSFYVYASGTGTYCVFLTNSAGDRSYVATYTVSAANTWEQKTITIAGDTTGTWLTTSGIGVSVRWDLGSGSSYNTATTSAWQAGDYRNTSSQVNVIGTSSATFYITGVQLEKGSTATSFDYRPYGTELQLAQRYAWMIPNNGGGGGDGAPISTSAYIDGASTAVAIIQFPVTMRTNPSISVTGSSNYEIGYCDGTITTVNGTSFSQSGVTSSSSTLVTIAASAHATQPAHVRYATQGTTPTFLISAEL